MSWYLRNKETRQDLRSPTDQGEQKRCEWAGKEQTVPVFKRRERGQEQQAPWPHIYIYFFAQERCCEKKPAV